MAVVDGSELTEPVSVFSGQNPLEYFLVVDFFCTDRTIYDVSRKTALGDALTGIPLFMSCVEVSGMLP